MGERVTEQSKKLNLREKKNLEITSEQQDGKSKHKYVSY